ncbi:MAG: bifunctional diguanylate cyclase/phosphodiesterase [Candidatus Eremiobacteraeota bacterium]|nr:bifunctional diguanylate cyclase/phosphodiesterase [Candidatus Eremiobacteraeota bacterium]MBC5827541.1 bifunctional diguanylate cyclase/phosphodiesterase [Candidatus Eremiobacteraeota bacterium]
MERLFALATDSKLDLPDQVQAVLDGARQALGLNFAAVGPLEGSGIVCDYSSGGDDADLQVGSRDTDFLAPFEVDGIRHALLLAGQGQLAAGDVPYVAQLVSFFSHAAHRERSEKRVSRLACEDTLTRLPNGAFCEDWVRKQRSTVESGKKQLALMIVALDRLTDVNASFGHATGDSVLIEATRLLRAATPDADLLGRIGGAEFCVASRAADESDIDVVGRRILDAFSAPLEVNGHTIWLTASVGIALGGTQALEHEQLFEDAHAALDEAKASDRERLRFFGSEVSERLQRRQAMQADLRRALRREEFCLFYQPVVDLATGNVQGAEALIRWNHPERGLIGPLDFVPDAEEAGLMLPIGAWVIERAMRQCRRWCEEGMRLRVSVNVSAKHFQAPAFTKQVAAAIGRSGVDASLMEVEITESVAMQHAAIVSSVLSELKTLGIRIALDDFGTGYSSLAYLKSLPVNIIKIDRAFIAGVPIDNDDTAIVRAIIAFTLCTGRQVRAEGVETVEQAHWLNAEGCDMAQGFLFGRPLPPDDFKQWRATYSAEQPPSEGAFP